MNRFMKLLVFEAQDIKNIHIKNLCGLQLMCKSRDIHLEFTSQIERLFLNDYDILFSITSFIEPTSLPSHVKIVLGPQMGTFEHPDLVGDYRAELEGRCVFNGLSEWVLTMLREFHPFKLPTVCFPFAVDTEQFQPRGFEKTLDCIVYIKHRNPTFVEQAIKEIIKTGISYEPIFYASYKEVDYMSLLDRAKFMICLDANESQGFALEEAMACDVPLLVCDVKSMYEEYYGDIQPHADLKPKELLATSVPYWSDACGVRIHTLEDLPSAIETMKTNEFHPRQYILETLSAGVCMDRILKYFQLI
jgi:hypothetical protein